MQNKRLTRIISSIFLTLLGILGMETIYSMSKIVTSNSSKKLPTEFIQFDKKISYCEERKLNNRIILITSRYCPHCKEATNLLLPLIKQYNLEPYFRSFDVINSNDLRSLNNIAISVPYVPTLIIDCDAYLGLKDKEHYDQLLAGFYYKTKKIKQ
jgi:hypothetical protein